MPLDQFIAELMDILTTQPGAAEILVSISCSGVTLMAVPNQRLSKLTRSLLKLSARWGSLSNTLPNEGEWIVALGTDPSPFRLKGSSEGG